MKITTILENSTVRHNLLSQHGQSLLIEHSGQKILFDVGEIYEGFIYNLQQFCISLEEVTAIVISHRHIDHIGSLPQLLPNLKNQKIVLPTQLGLPDIKKAGPKYIFINHDQTTQYNVAISEEVVGRLMRYPLVTIADKAQLIAPDLWTTGCIGAGMQEQALVYDQKEYGLTILVGCSHPGLAAFVDKAREITGNKKIRGIIGGFHFNPLTDDQVKEQAEYMKSLQVEYIFPNHCTGIKQTMLLQQLLPKETLFSKTYSVGTGNAITVATSISVDFV